MKRIKTAALGVLCVCLSFSFSGCFHDVDYAKWSTDIAKTTMLSNVTVQAENYNLGFNSSTLYATGSGMIFYQDSNTYYALTNNHVVHRQDGYSMISYTVEDCFDHEFTASYVYGDADYDLAVVKFTNVSTKDETVNLAVTRLAETNATKGRALAAIGQPQGQDNCLTFGKVLRYEQVTIENVDLALSNVQFETLVHNCFTLSGSSGGAIVNEDLQIVGIHYACGTDTDGNFVEGYAVPVEKIRQFLMESGIFTLT